MTPLWCSKASWLSGHWWDGRPCPSTACVAFTIAAAVATAGPASAATGNGCAQGWSDYPGTCIWVTTGDKDSANNTQWVSSIKIRKPREGTSSFLEGLGRQRPHRHRLVPVGQRRDRDLEH